MGSNPHRSLKEQTAELIEAATSGAKSVKKTLPHAHGPYTAPHCSLA